MTQFNTKFFLNGRNKRSEEYTDDSGFHRTDGPAITFFHEETGNKWSEHWYMNNKIHRLDGPAETSWYKNGNVHYAKYLVNGQLHKTNGPAETFYAENGKKKSEKWLINGEMQKEFYYFEDSGSVAEQKIVIGTNAILLQWYENGQLKQETHYENHKIHKPDGPAVILWNEDGSLDEAIYAFKGHYPETHSDEGLFALMQSLQLS